MDLSNMLIIDEDNWRDHIGVKQDDGTIILPDDHPHNGGERRFMGCTPRISVPGSLSFAAAPTFTVIPRNEWSSRIRDLNDAKASLKHISDDQGIESLDQNGTNYCHANSATNGVIYTRCIQGESYVKLSPGSVGGPVTNYTNSGANIESDLRQIVDHGVAPISMVPANQISRHGWAAGAEQEALKYRITDWWDMMTRQEGGMFDRCATLLLQNIPVCVGYNWWSHAVTLIALVEISSGKYGFLFRNSWGASYGDNGFAVLAEGKGTPDDAYAPRQAVAIP